MHTSRSPNPDPLTGGLEGLYTPVTIKEFNQIKSPLDKQNS